ncbi:MAG: hypothetical protein KJ879_01680 [Nanoarchaeota archaeon]|nr:hypothetical protein [Nanoarchaeota archaeon]
MKDCASQIQFPIFNRVYESLDYILPRKQTKNSLEVICNEFGIGGKVFFIEPRNATSEYREETINQKTGEVISKIKKQFSGTTGKMGAEFHYGVRYDEKEKKAFLTKFKIVEFDEPK